MLNKRRIKRSTTDEDLALERAERSQSRAPGETPSGKGEIVELEEPEVIISEKELERKVATLAEWIKEREVDEKRFIVFHVGSGVSAGDALASMYRYGFVDWTVTQNCDGLLQKAGYPPENLSEVHGNVFKEICPECGVEYFRDFAVKAEAVNEDHRTGRICEDRSCKGELVDNLVHYGELLNDEATAQVNSKRATISVALENATAAHASEWVFSSHHNKKRGKVVTVNQHKTPADSDADLVIHHKAEPFCQALLRALQIADSSNDADYMNK